MTPEPMHPLDMDPVDGSLPRGVLNACAIEVVVGLVILAICGLLGRAWGWW